MFTNFLGPLCDKSIKPPTARQKVQRSCQLKIAEISLQKCKGHATQG